MPLIDRIKPCSPARATTRRRSPSSPSAGPRCAQQRDRSYEEMGALEQQEEELSQQFKDATGAITKRRITSQLLQLRKDMERRQQLLAVLNQQINVVSTHLHNLELVARAAAPSSPTPRRWPPTRSKAEEMLAELEAEQRAGRARSTAVGAPRA